LVTTHNYSGTPKQSCRIQHKSLKKIHSGPQ
jgi:hypothetical protein